MKFIIGLVIGASISAAIFYRKSEPIANTPSDKIVSRFKDLSENEARLYAGAKTAEEKLKAADALYGKMMIIFLADLALKLQPIHQVDPVMVEQTMKEPVEVVEPVEKPATLTDTMTTAPAQSEKPKDKMTPEAKLHMEYKDAYESKKLDRRTRRMVGTFQGTLRHTSGKDKGRIDSVLITMDFTQAGKELDGSSTVVLTDPQGQEYSRGSSNGGSGALKLHPTDEDLVFIDVARVGYISLSISKLRGVFVYEGKTIGNVQLQRK